MPIGLTKCLSCLKSTGKWLVSRNLGVGSARRRLTPDPLRDCIIRLTKEIWDQRLRLRVTLIFRGLVRGNPSHARQAVYR